MDTKKDGKTHERSRDVLTHKLKGIGIFREGGGAFVVRGAVNGIRIN